MDPAIIDLPVIGDGDAFALIVREKASELLAVAYRILRDPETWPRMPSSRHSSTSGEELPSLA